MMGVLEKMPHIQLDAGIGTDRVILPGDPARVDRIAAHMTDVEETAFNREYKSVTGYYNGKKILAMSTGMGGPSTAIGVEELADIGIRYAIRIGSCGALQTDLHNGDLLIAEKAVCDDGASQAYLDYNRYACAQLNGDRKIIGDKELLLAEADGDLAQLCETVMKDLGFTGRKGCARSHDALYIKGKEYLDDFYSKAGVDGSDMETAALLAVGALRGIKACSILNVVVEWKADLKDGIGGYADGGAAAAAEGERREILTALETLSRI